MDQAVALWKVMFLSKGMMSFKGVRRSMEMKFLHTGSKMKATSTWRMRAAVRATAGRQVGAGGRAPRERKVSKIRTHVSGRRVRTEAISVQRPGVVQVVLELVVNEAKGKDEEVEEDPEKEKQATATLIDHPDIPLVDEPLGLVRLLRGSGGCVRALEGLQTPPFGPVSL